jgi:hypothetical protein
VVSARRCGVRSGADLGPLLSVWTDRLMSWWSIVSDMLCTIGADSNASVAGMMSTEVHDVRNFMCL